MLEELFLRIVGLMLVVLLLPAVFVEIQKWKAILTCNDQLGMEGVI
jgi:uncharacterized membrane protein